MKKIKFIFLNALIIIFFSASFSLAFDIKKYLPFLGSSKEVPTKTTAPAQTKTQPPAVAAKASAPGQSQPPAATAGPAKGQVQPPAATLVSTKGKAQPIPTTVVPVPVQGKIQPAAKTANMPVPGPVTPASPASMTQTKLPAVVPAANVTTVSSAPLVAPDSSAPGQVNVYSYNPMGKPDPFMPFIEVELAKQKLKKAESEKKAALSIFPLQRAETITYKVVGIVGNDDHRVAIAEDSAKKFYPLLIGTRIGLHNGKVVEILADRVIVEEEEDNKPKKVILKLRKN